jgi:SAM-dependent methyltransferase
MRRETTNRIRYVIEELLPPALRDTSLFRWAMERVWGKHIQVLADFRAKAPFLTAQEYESLYQAHPRVHDETDNSQACIAHILENIKGPSVCDIGCGTGHLLKRIQQHSGTYNLTGIDLVTEPRVENNITFVKGWIEALPFPDQAFDTVICTHVLEHILDIQTAFTQLRRICKKQLIIVVPQEREGIYTFNPHFNFFPYPHSFLRYAQPKGKFICKSVGRDIFYLEEREEKRQD